MEQRYDEGNENALIRQGLVPPEQMSRAREIRQATGGDIEDIMVKEGFATNEDLMLAMSLYLEIPYIKLSLGRIDPEAVKHGVAKVLEGVTSLDEIRRTLPR